MTDEYLNPAAVWISYKLPFPLKITLGLGFSMWMLPAWSAVFDTHQYDIAAICFLLGGGLLFFIYKNKSGYRIAWDNDRIYMRDWGFRNPWFHRKHFHSIEYKNIKSIKGSFGKNAHLKSRFMPYEYLVIDSYKKIESNIWIYPLSLNKKDLSDLMNNFFQKRPDLFSKEMIDMIYKDGLMDIIDAELSLR